MIKAGEISEIIKRQLAGYEAEVDLQEVGRVIEVGDGIARVHGLEKAMAGELLAFPGDVVGMVLNLEQDQVGAVLLGDDTLIKEGDIGQADQPHRPGAGRRGARRSRGERARPADRRQGSRSTPRSSGPSSATRPASSTAARCKEPLQTGLKAIDAMIPIGRGQRELIIGDRGTGKTAIGVDTIINQKGQDVFCFYVAIGQKRSTVAQVVKIARGRRRDGLHHRGRGLGVGAGAAAVHRAVHRRHDGRVLPRQRSATRSASTTICPSTRPRTGSCRSCCGGRRAARRIRATSSISTRGCSSARRSSTTSSAAARSRRCRSSRPSSATSPPTSRPTSSRSPTARSIWSPTSSTAASGRP